MVVADEKYLKCILNKHLILTKKRVELIHTPNSLDPVSQDTSFDDLTILGGQLAL